MQEMPLTASTVNPSSTSRLNRITNFKDNIGSSRANLDKKYGHASTHRDNTYVRLFDVVGMSSNRFANRGRMQASFYEPEFKQASADLRQDSAERFKPLQPCRPNRRLESHSIDQPNDSRTFELSRIEHRLPNVDLDACFELQSKAKDRGGPKLCLPKQLLLNIKHISQRIR